MLKLTTILPRPLNQAGLKQALIDGMRDVGVEIRESFEDTTSTWDNKPRFDPPFPIPRVGMDEITVETSTENLIYKFISDGTKKNYPIPANPVPGKRLAFSSKFIPKTFPGIIGSGAGFNGPIDRFPEAVIHPGIEARKFDLEIKNKQEKNIKKMMENALKIARRASGHAYP